MAERICALLGSGKGPRVPTGASAKLEVSGVVSEFRVYHPLGFETIHHLRGDGVWHGPVDIPDCDWIEIEHEGSPSAAFFVLR